MKKQLLKKLSAFIIPIAIGMIFSVSATAQIVYTDVIPDRTVNTNNGIYRLDLNNDGTNDFNITYTTTVFGTTTYLNAYIRITPLGANKVGNDTTYPGSLPLNALIDSSSFKWLSNANQILRQRVWRIWGATNPPRYVPVYNGNWNGASNKYIPLQLDVNSQKYYGWVRLDVVTGAASFTVKDYAYNSTPNQSILAGQTITTGINENYFASSINLFPNPADNHFTIDLGSNNKKVEVTISDITGKIIHTTTTDDPDSYRENKIEVNTDGFAEGIYIVRIQAGEFITTKKIIVKK